MARPWSGRTRQLRCASLGLSSAGRAGHSEWPAIAEMLANWRQVRCRSDCRRDIGTAMRRACGVERRRIGLPEEPAEQFEYLAAVELAFPETRNNWYANVFEVHQCEAAAMDVRRAVGPAQGGPLRYTTRSVSR